MPSLSRSLAPRAPRALALVIIALSALAGLGVTVGVGGAAHAAASPTPPAKAPVWQARTSVKHGTTDIAFDLHTSGGCPPPSTNMLGWMRGRGLPKEGAIIVSNLPAGSSDQPFVAPLGDTLDNIMSEQPNPTKFQGIYQLRLQCITPEQYGSSWGEYAVNIKFDTPRRWHALPPVTQQMGPNILKATPTPGASASPGSNGGAGAKGGKGTPDGTSPAPSGVPTPSVDPAQQRAEQLGGQVDELPAAEGRKVSWPLFAAGAALLAVVVGAVVRSRLRARG